MRALTERHPWAWAISYWGKPVENRTWAPPGDLLGQRFAIHAGKLLPPGKGGAAGDAYWEEIQDTVTDIRAIGLGAGPVTPRQLVAASSAIVCTVRLAGVIGPTGYLRARGEADTELCIEARKSRYFSGPVGWVMADKLVLPVPVACSGKQGLWSLPPDVERQVLEQERLARLMVSDPADKLLPRREQGT